MPQTLPYSRGDLLAPSPTNTNSLRSSMSNGANGGGSPFMAQSCRSPSSRRKQMEAHVVTYTEPQNPGTTPAYLLRDEMGPLGVFKPVLTNSAMNSEERKLPAGIFAEDAVKKECAAYRLDHGAFSGVPRTCLRKLSLGEDGVIHNLGPAEVKDLVVAHDKGVLAGSLQMHVAHECSAEDMGSSKFTAADVHKIAILDIRLCSLDRHEGNILVSRDTSGSLSLHPIDHGYCLPDVRQLSDTYFCWSSWPQAKEPFSDTELEYIRNLNPLLDLQILLQLEIRPEELLTNLVCTMLLKECARQGLTPFDIAQLMQRPLGSEAPTILQLLVDAAADAAKLPMRIRFSDESVAAFLFAFVRCLRKYLIDSRMRAGETPAQELESAVLS